MSNMSNKKIAITGTIGSGKSTVTKYIEKQYPTISSDAIVNEMYCDKSFIREVNKLIYNKNSDLLDKKDLAQLIFNDEVKKGQLEALIHPLVKQKIIEFMNQQNGMVFVEVPLLFEADFVSLFDHTIVVVADDETILNRLKEFRGYTAKEAEERIKNQFPVDYKIKHADSVIYNNKSLQDLHREIDTVLGIIKEGI